MFFYLLNGYNYSLNRLKPGGAIFFIQKKALFIDLKSGHKKAGFLPGVQK
jgi:hypothetical protein